MKRPRLFLDSNILVDAQVRDIFLTIAEAQLIDLRWSEGVLDETRRVLANQRGIERPRIDYLISKIKTAFPRSTVAAATITPLPVALPDADDLHVLSAAVGAGCDLLVTNNLRDFPDETVAPLGLSVLSPDAAIVMLVRYFPHQVPAITRRLVAELRRPPVTIQEFLDRLAQRAPSAADALSTALASTPEQQ